MPAPRQQESRPRVLCVLGFGNDAQAFGSLVPAARQRSSCSEYKSRRSLYHTEQVQEPTSCAPCALFLGRSTTWSALLMQRSLHSRTALLCAAVFPMLFAVSIGEAACSRGGTHGSAVLLCRLRGSKRADHAVLRVPLLRSRHGARISRGQKDHPAPLFSAMARDDLL